jgi:hypothetical protein
MVILMLPARLLAIAADVDEDLGEFMETLGVQGGKPDHGWAQR